MRRIVNWSNLPDEICIQIVKGLDNRLDVLRFRSVCKFWRHSVPPSNAYSSPLPPLRFRCFPPGSDVFVSSHSFYHIEVAHDDQDPSTPRASSPSSFSKGCLVKVEEVKPGKLRLLDPFSSHRIRDFPDNFSKTFSLLEFRMIELTKAYALRYASESSFPNCTNKVIISPYSGSHIVDESSSIFVIYDQRKLGFAKNGDNDITLIDDRNLDCNDMIVHKGQVYVVDRTGTVSWVDPSLRVIKFSPPLFGFGHSKHLVVSCGELYVVDRYLGREVNKKEDARGRVIDFKVYKLDEEWGRWVEVKNLGDRAFILSIECSLSVSVQEFTGISENCIYFTKQLLLGHDLRGFSNHVGIFNLEDRNIKTLEFSPVLL